MSDFFDSKGNVVDEGEDSDNPFHAILVGIFLFILVAVACEFLYARWVGFPHYNHTFTSLLKIAGVGLLVFIGSFLLSLCVYAESISFLQRKAESATKQDKVNEE